MARHVKQPLRIICSSCVSSLDLMMLPIAALLSLLLLVGSAVAKKLRHIRSRTETDDEAHKSAFLPSNAEVFYNYVRLICTVTLLGLQLVFRSETSACLVSWFTYVLSAIYVCEQSICIILIPLVYVCALLALFRIAGIAHRVTTTIRGSRCASGIVAACLLDRLRL